jgi:predicted nucleotide-binding protein
MEDLGNQAAQEVSHRVFVVHGRDGEYREAVARFLEQLGLEAVILHEQPNRGRTLITKFREEASDIGFAIVLMTPDDTGGMHGGEQHRRARQNVIFELGFFIGALGPDRVAALVSNRVERPSDFDGVVYIPIETDWRLPLCKELRAAGYDIDMNKVF